MGAQLGTVLSLAQGVKPWEGIIPAQAAGEAFMVTLPSPVFLAIALVVYTALI